MILVVLELVLVALEVVLVVLELVLQLLVLQLLLQQLLLQQLRVLLKLPCPLGGWGQTASGPPSDIQVGPHGSDFLGSRSSTRKN